jgi:hypothetical protein
MGHDRWQPPARYYEITRARPEATRDEEQQYLRVADAIARVLQAV